MSLMFLHSKSDLAYQNATMEKLASNGLGPLYEVLSATAHEVLDGEFEIEFEYPADGDLTINYGDIITAKPRPSTKYHPFIVDKIDKPMNGIVKYHASYILSLLSGVVVGPIDANKPEDVMDAISGSAVVSSQLTKFNERAEAGTALCYPFDFIRLATDVTTEKAFSSKNPTSALSLFGDEIEGGSLLNVYEGEYAYDPIDYDDQDPPVPNSYIYIRFLQNRGVHRDIVIQYGTNLEDFELEEDFSDLYTDIIPFYNSGDRYVLGNPVHTTKTYPITKFMAVDVTSELNGSGTPTVEQVTQAGQTYFEKNKLDEHDATLTVKADTTSGFDELDLGDTLSIRYEIYNYDAILKFTEYETDIINDRFIEMKFDTAKAKAKTVSSIIASSSVATHGEVSQSKKAQGSTSESSGGGGGSGAGLSNATPLMDGEASAGTSNLASRSDHRHPSNSAKLNVGAIIPNQDIEDIINS